MITTPRDADLGAALRRAVDDDFEAAQVPWLRRVVDQREAAIVRAGGRGGIDAVVGELALRVAMQRAREA